MGFFVLVTLVTLKTTYIHPHVHTPRQVASREEILPLHAAELQLSRTSLEGFFDSRFYVSKSRTTNLQCLQVRAVASYKEI